MTNSKTEIVTKIKNSYCLMNSNCDETQIVMKFKNSNCDETQKLKWRQNSKTQIVTKL